MNALACNESGPRPGVAELSRLTNEQYANTLRDLFAGIATVPTVALHQENLIAGFSTIAAGQASSLSLLEGYYDAAKSLAVLATTGANLEVLAPCSAGQNEDACADAFIRSFGKRAFRRPLSTDETARLQQVFRATRTSDNYTAAINDVIQALLMAPQFAFRVEATTAADGTVVPLTSHQIASRLSYFL